MLAPDAWPPGPRGRAMPGRGMPGTCPVRGACGAAASSLDAWHLPPAAAPVAPLPPWMPGTRGGGWTSGAVLHTGVQGFGH